MYSIGIKMNLKEKIVHQKLVDHIKSEIANYAEAVERKTSFSEYAAKRITALETELSKITGVK